MTQPATNSNQSLPPHLADADAVTGILGGLEGMLRDLQHVIASVSLADYSAASAGQSSIGAHMRHVLEFIQVLADSVDTGVVDYESRQHNGIYEREPHAVSAMLPQLYNKLSQALRQRGAYHPLLLCETAMLGGDKLTVTSSLGREVLFMLQHGVHHLAIIKMQAAAMNISFGPMFGVAVATQAYREKING